MQRICNIQSKSYTVEAKRGFCRVKRLGFRLLHFGHCFTNGYPTKSLKFSTPWQSKKDSVRNTNMEMKYTIEKLDSPCDTRIKQQSAMMRYVL